MTVQAADAPHPAVELLPALAAALAGTRWAGLDLVPLPDTGLAHHHVALVGSTPPVLARIPKQSQLRLDAAHNLAYQAACFARAAPSGHTPRLHAVLERTPGLHRGALIVEHVAGRAAVLPDDLDALVRALASIHSLPIPDEDAREPLMSPADPLADLADEIRAQAAFLDRAELEPKARVIIERELESLATLVRRQRRPSATLISFDAHPGNFIVRDNGEAVLVDLEKCRYSYPSLDLAHATLYTSTTWEQGSDVSLSPADTAGAYDLWTSMTEDTDAADWHVPLRVAMWLWSVTWCAKWRVLSGAAPSTSADGEDWASANSADALALHVRGRVDHYLDAVTVRRITDEFALL